MNKWSLLLNIANRSLSLRLKPLAILYAAYLLVIRHPLYQVLEAIGFGLNDQSVLDVGCGERSPISCLDCRRIGVDAHEASLLQAKANFTHEGFVLARASKLSIAPRTFDCVVALDVTEHLSKVEGQSMIRELEAIAQKKVVIFTPNGFAAQHDHRNPFQLHKSGWSAAEFEAMGYRVSGTNGPRALRYRPGKIHALARDLASLLSWILLRRDPEGCFQLLCVKDFVADSFRTERVI